MLGTVSADGHESGAHTLDPISHEELLSRISAGDHAAFAEIYDRLAPRVLGLVVRLLRDHAQSEEVTQEVFLEIWQTATRYDAGRGGAVPWVLTVAHRRAVDRVRSAQASRDRDTREGIRDYRAEYDSVADGDPRRAPDRPRSSSTPRRSPS
jgi:RNA polymerase sigma-70 factor (ECF subfamily)